MAQPIVPTPTLRGTAAKRFIELAENPPPLKPVKILTKKEVRKLFKGIVPKQGGNDASAALERRGRKAAAISTVFDVANYFLARNDPAEAGHITALKLQKLVYYAQGYSLAILGRPLFGEPIHAWELGPVCIPLYRKFKNFKDAPLDRVYKTTVEATKALQAAQKPFAQEVINLLEDVYACYSGFTAMHLSRMTHKTTPWEKAFPDGEIAARAMKSFFSGQLNGATIEPVRLSREEADKIATRLGVNLQ